MSATSAAFNIVRSGEETPVPSSRSDATRVEIDEKGPRSPLTRAISTAGYEAKGVTEIDEDGKKKQVMVVLEQRTGKELMKDVEKGPYTVPRWRHSLPFVKARHPPPPPPLSLEDAPLIPQIGASWFSSLVFNWVTPIMALGASRTLQDSDLYRLDEAREAKPLSQKVLAAYDARVEAADQYNTRLLDPNTPLPRIQRMIYPFLPHRSRREHDYRTKHGKKRASIGMSLWDVMGWYYMFGGFIKVVADLCNAMTPLLIRALIAWAAEYEVAKGVGAGFPSMGRGAGLAVGLFLLLSVSSLCIHHFFVRSMAVGVMARAALISAIYQRSLQFTQKSRGEIPNGKLVNHISTDISRIDFAAGFAHMIWTSPIQMIVIIIILLVEIGYSALPGIAFLLIMTTLQTRLMKNLFLIRKKAAVWTDKRAKGLQELLAGMRVVKYMAWENPFLERIRHFRGMELKYIRKLMIFRSAMMAFAMSLPVIAALLSFVTFSLTVKSLSAATLFTVITLFQLMRLPLMILPMSMSATADAYNALTRLTVVFEAEIVKDKKIVDSNMKEAVRVEHASFTWDAAPEEETGKAKGKSKGKGKGAKGDNEKRSDGKKKRRMIWNKRMKKVTVADELHAEVAAPQAIEGETAKEGMGIAADLGMPPLPELEKEAPAQRVFQLQDINLNLPRGSLTAIVGPIGSGKSSLLQGLIGEMRKTEGKVAFSGSTALCAQTPWIQNATVRENILFGQPWDEERYWAAVRDSCLEPDLELLDDGDATEIGEKGINISGGQKQRVNIARAVYFDADIIALDDPLSALDAGVGKALFFNAIVGALGGKTRILVTHALHFLPYVDNIIMMEDGRISEQGSYNELKEQNGAFARLIREFGSEEHREEELENEADALEQAGPQSKHDRTKMVAKGSVHALMQTEERNTGAIKKGTFGDYFKMGNGAYLIPTLLVACVVAQGFTVVTSYWLVWWQEYKFGHGNNFYLGIYAALGIASAISLFFQGLSTALINYFASVNIHRKAIKRVMFAPQSFFDTTPLGRIMNRFAKDTDTIDNTLGDSMRMTVQTLGNIIGSVILLGIVEPYFLIAMAAVSIMYVQVAMFYRRSSREFKRLDSILRSSLYSHFSESLSGVATIRSYGETERFFEDNFRRVDVENRAYFLTVVNQRWMGLRLDVFGTLLTFAIAIIVVTQHGLSAAKAGLGLSTVVTVSQSFSWLIRTSAEVENDMVGAERIMHYANELEQEAPHEINEVKPQGVWPNEGKIEFNNVKMRYRAELPEVLKGLTLNVGASEKIGVVGRTGAGKSSIMVALFRMSELSSGTIKIDGVDVSKIGLNDLRSGISIIPQDPLLFSGTLRSNIDPFNTKTDAELYDTLRRAHLVNSTSGDTTPEGTTPSNGRRFTLDTAVEEEGGNLSVGEKSLVSLARALVRGTKVLVLDEATASVDVETDAKIQETIRTEFRDRTLLCIAHRLKTILSYDRILVMSEGQVAEFDTPENLFLRNGIFTEMCSKASIGLPEIRAAASLRF